ncbi:hypothetical protein CW751_06100 [Brumimicrobium salinarum]|uniref:Uncharacterized protein n=1 Tax=Brumimicrobium salinarum TaxID=2058658 RepID=A0A2I0R3K1_9FLAO|nr:hypothetical protein [Brumimicrobium salinarum]PKR81153.1 hypothetical protein CW751_06100 [Brumimicrobium salinarum]
MRKFLLIAITSFLFIGAEFSYAQKGKKELNCFERYENAFKDRGSYTISDNIYRNVMISFFEGDEVFCVRGKVRVENGYVSAIFYYYDDNTEELYDKKFHNLNNEPPTISNGISEMIINADREKFRVVFIDKLKPKRKSLQRMSVPDDL